MKRALVAIVAAGAITVPVAAFELSAPVNAAGHHHKHKHHHGRVPTDNKTITGWGINDPRP